MKIILDCPKKVKKAIGLQRESFELNESSSILEKIKNYATQNKSRITFGLKIVDEQGEEEFEEKVVFTSDSTTNLLVLLRQSLYTESYSETPATEKEFFLSQVEKALNQPHELFIEPKMESQKEAILTAAHQKNVPFWKGDPFKFMLIVDVALTSFFLWQLNLHTLAILLLVGGGVFIAFKKTRGKTHQKQRVAPSALVVQSEHSEQQETTQSQIEESEEQAFPSAEDTAPFVSSSETVESTPIQDVAASQINTEPLPEIATQPEETFPNGSDLAPQPQLQQIYKVPHTVKSTTEKSSSLKSAEENRNQNLEWLSQQIQGFKDKEMQIIIEKQRELETLHPETIEAMNEAKEKIDEIYQLQLAFEKKWKVA